MNFFKIFHTSFKKSYAIGIKTIWLIAGAVWRAWVEVWFKFVASKFKKNSTEAFLENCAVCRMRNLWTIHDTVCALNTTKVNKISICNQKFQFTSLQSNAADTVSIITTAMAVALKIILLAIFHFFTIRTELFWRNFPRRTLFYSCRKI